MASKTRDKDDEAVIENLFKENNKLKSQVNSLNEKNKSLSEQLDKKSREVLYLKKHINAPKKSDKKDRPSTAPEVDVVPAPTHFGHKEQRHSEVIDFKDNFTSVKENVHDENLLEIAKKYKSRYYIFFIIYFYE